MNASAAARRQAARAFGWLALAALLWAGNQIAARGVAGHMPPVALALGRWSTAFLILLPATLAEMLRHRSWIARHLGLLLAASASGVVAFNTLFYLALTGTQAINAGIANSLIPVAILLLAWAVDRRRPPFAQSLGVVVSMLGAVVVFARGSLDVLLGLDVPRYDVLLLAGVFAWAVYSLALGRLRRPPGLSALGFLAITIGLGLPILLLLWSAEVALTGALPVLDLPTLGATLYTGVFASIAAFLAWNAGVATLGPSRAGVSLHLIPVFSILLAWPLLGETPQAYHAAGLGLILLGVALAGLGPSRPRPADQHAGRDG